MTKTSATREIAMRYGKDQKQATRQRILEAAGRRFKQDGIDGAGVAAVMSDAGLTNGAFYHHFASKEDLVANVLAMQHLIPALFEHLPEAVDGQRLGRFRRVRAEVVGF